MSFTPPQVKPASMDPPATVAAFEAAFCASVAPITRPAGNTSCVAKLPADGNDSMSGQLDTAARPAATAAPVAPVDGIDQSEE